MIYITDIMTGMRCDMLSSSPAEARWLRPQAKPVNERLRHLGGTAKLAVDVLEYEDAMERAFTFICGCSLGLGI